LLTLAATGFALFMHIGIYFTQVSREAWQPPTSYIRQHYKQGDAIGLMPHWALMGAEPLRGLPVLFAEKLHEEDLSRYQRLWVMRAPHLGRWWFQSSFRAPLETLRKRYWLRETKRFGKVIVYLFQLPPPLPLLYDFSQKPVLRSAEVGLETPPDDQRLEGCPPRSVVGQVKWLRRWQERPGWFLDERHYFFGRILQEIEDTPRDCLWAMPKRCEILRVRYRNVPLRGALLVEHGIGTATPSNLAPEIKASGPDVMITILAEGRQIGQMRVSQKQGWRRRSFEISGISSTQSRGSVEFLIQSLGLQHTDRPGYCFRATLRDLPPPTTRPTQAPR
jgi:hypothetical protein